MSRGIGLVLAVVVLGGCTAVCAPASWEIDFDDGSVATGAQNVTVRVRQGTCASPGAVLVEQTLVRGGMRMQLPALGRGPFALEATALDSTCVVIGRACTDIPASQCPSAIQQTLESVTRGSPQCTACTAGLCDPPPDGGLRDGRTCASSETDCNDGRDDDCDGQVDCEDSSCEGERGPCGGTCLQGACCDGCRSGSSCETGTSRHSCGRNGEACMDCGSSCDCSNGSCSQCG